MAKSNDGASGIDGVTFESIEESGRESFLRQIQNALVEKRISHASPVRKRFRRTGKEGPRSFDSRNT